MQDKIQYQIEKELRMLAEQREIKFLYAVESGSRAWGFSSIDSDWDVRFIYVHQRDWYLSIDNHKDNIEQILPNGIDCVRGWRPRQPPWKNYDSLGICRTPFYEPCTIDEFLNYFS